MTISRHQKTQKSSKSTRIINKFEPPGFAQLGPSRNAPEARFVGVAQTLIKPMEINQNDNFETSTNTKISKTYNDYHKISIAWIRTI